MLTPQMRTWLAANGVIVLLAGMQLFVLADQTERFFAWTINPSLTAAFLGAGYFASLPLVYLSSRKPYWVQARTGVFGILIFTLVTLGVTLLHLERFHLDSAIWSARAAAWVWLVVYVAVPPLMLALIVWQLRQPGQNLARGTSLPGWLRSGFAAQGVVMFVYGALMLLVPNLVPWPWTLTALTSRAVGAWLVGIGIVAAQCSWENDWGRVQVALQSYALLALLQLAALVRYAATVEWTQPSSWVYSAWLVIMLALGGAGSWLARNATRSL